MHLNIFVPTSTKYIEILCLFHLLYSTYVSAQSFVSVSICPKNQTEWTRRARAKNCLEPTPDYLCATVQDEPRRYGEICTVFGLAIPGTCAVLSKSTYNMDFLPCRVESGCPETHYTPSELYKYPVCFQNFYGNSVTAQSSTMLPEETTSSSIDQTDIDESSNIGIVLGMLVLAVILATVVIISVLYYKKKLPEQMQSCIRRNIQGAFRQYEESSQEGINKDEENVLMIPEERVRKLSTISIEERKRTLLKIHKLPRYLTHILKCELKVLDLKEKLIIYSVSLNEHFTARLLKDLENVNNIEDYDNFDMMVVFTLLMNFCSQLKPHETAWGYKPSDDDFSVGADVERIRILWNLYCDNQVNVPHLQEVYRRMTNKFGELPGEQTLTNPDEAECNALKSKIQIIRLKRNCDVENGTVVTENIKTALTLLDTSDIVICIGAIGCGKTTAMRYIQDIYEDRGWKTIWFEEYINESDLIESEIKDTLLCCDNLFGTFNSNVFSFESVTGFELVIQKQREKCIGHLKVLLGIHQHVYDAISKLGRIQLFNTKNFIDIDKLDKAEMLLIWIQLKKEGHCARDPGCWFKKIDFPSVFSKLSLSQGLVGNPILMWMYCQHHDFFINEDFTRSPVAALVNHSKRMQEDNEELFLVLVYVMFVGVCKVDQGIMPWSGLLSAELTEDSIKRCVEKYPVYLTEENNTIELKHEILTISLFKVSYDTPTVFSALVHHCDISIILQLTRTKEECDSDFVNCLPSSYTDDKLMVKLLERIAKAKGCPFNRPHYLARKLKNRKS